MARRSAKSVLQPAHSSSDTSEMEFEDSQRVSALNSLLKTPKTNDRELQSFDEKVAGGQQELRTLLEHRTRQAEEVTMHRRNELTSAILAALQTPNRPVQGVPPTLSDTKIVRNAVFKSVAHVLTVSEHLVGEYDRLEKVIAGMRDAEPEGIAEAWTEDVEKTARLLRVGAETAVKNVKKVLGADVEADDAKDNRGENEETSTVQEMELNYELKKSLYSADRGVRKMVQSLPQD